MLFSSFSLITCHPPLFYFFNLFSFFCALSFSVFCPTVFHLPFTAIQSPPIFSLHLYSLTHLLFFYLPPLLLVVLGSAHQAYWHRLVVEELCHDYTHTHTQSNVHMCVHAQTCWWLWLMSSARLSASMPIRPVQEISLRVPAQHGIRLHTCRPIGDQEATHVSTSTITRRIADQTQVQPLQS